MVEYGRRVEVAPASKERVAAHVTADLFLLGVTGVHPTAGLTTGDADEVAMKRTLAGRAAETYVLASADKIGAASAYRVLPLAAVTGVITDARHSDPTVRKLAGARILAAVSGTT